MMNEKEAKRPELKGLILDGTKGVEQFQNEVLRPIIKLQHSLLIATFKKSSEKRKINFTNLDIESIETHIKITCKRDIAYKNIILGMIIGHFTVKEYGLYTLSVSEYNKRIIQIVKNRLLDSISELT